ncbi:hypothetical protein BDF22DRAFT_662631 [Syncephalis plumigaleata]|nr:hypothetical protein BDF22DRAFT_662631 [Syncephalis plumigaleata]
MSSFTILKNTAYLTAVFTVLVVFTSGVTSQTASRTSQSNSTLLPTLSQASVQPSSLLLGSSQTPLSSPALPTPLASLGVGGTAIASGTPTVPVSSAVSTSTPTGDPSSALPKCEAIQKRNEIRALTPKQRQAFFDAVKKLQSGPQPNKFDEFVGIHNNVSNYAHASPVFLPWHRAFLHKFERALQDVDTTVTLPYWDWSYDSQAPEASVVLSAEYFGGNGRPGDQCLTNGQFFEYRPMYKTTIDKNNAINSFHSTEVVQQLITKTDDFPEFTRKLESIMHARVHIGLGGHMNTMQSAVDPIFYLHHAMIDKIWATWQRIHSHKAKSYSGTMRDGSKADANHVMLPWNDLRVREVFSTRNLCYEYAELTEEKLKAGSSGTESQQKDLPPPSIDVKKNAFKVFFSDKPSTNLMSSNGTRNGNVDNGKIHGFTPMKDLSTGEICFSANRGSTGTLTIFLSMDNTTTTATTATTPPADKVVILEVVRHGSNDTSNVTADTKTPLPNGTDRHSLTQLRKPEAVTDAWLKMNGLNETEITAIRNKEDNLSELYVKINLIDHYVSPSALGNRPDLLTSILGKSDSSFNADYGQIAINVRLPKGQTMQNPTLAVSNMRALASSYMNAVKNTAADKREESQITIKKVEELVGVMQKSDTDDVITNPNYAARSDWGESWKEGKTLWQATKLHASNGKDTVKAADSDDSGAAPSHLKQLSISASMMITVIAFFIPMLV